jgi:hypothetical protein
MDMIIDAIAKALRHRSVRNKNAQNRNVTNYLPSQVGGFVDKESCYENTLVSGGDAQIRSEAINALCISAANAGLPVIVLHQGDDDCVRELKKTFFGWRNFYVADSANPIFDPIYGLTGGQLCEAVVESAPERFKITSNGGAYIMSLTTALSTKIQRFPLPALLDLSTGGNMMNLLTTGALPQSVSGTVQALYTQGQQEISAVNQYISKLYSECKTVLPKSLRDYSKCIDMDTVILNKGILVLDVVSDMNKVYIALLFELISELIRNNKKFLLVLDGLAITEENGIKHFLSYADNKIGKCISDQDIFSLCGCDENLFQTLLGRSQKWFIFKHGAAKSAEQWSKGIGIYSKIETSQNFGSGMASGYGWGSGAMGTSSNVSGQHSSGESLYLKNEEKVRPFEIQDLTARQGFIVTNTSRQQELAYVSQFNY